MQIKLKSKICWLALTLLLAVTGCKKNLTSFYADPVIDSLSIFSNKGYNVMTCFINGQAWQTTDRTIGGFGASNNEISISKQVSIALMDTLVIKWNGHFKNGNSIPAYISLLLPIAKGFSRKDFASFEGKRIIIDSTNGIFAYSDGSFYFLSRIGKGTVFFEQAHIDSLGNNYFGGKLSGLFEATIGEDKITSGRFDHDLGGGQVRPF